MTLLGSGWQVTQVRRILKQFLQEQLPPEQVSVDEIKEGRRRRRLGWDGKAPFDFFCHAGSFPEENTASESSVSELRDNVGRIHM